MVTASPLFHGNLRVPQALLMTVSHDHWGNWMLSVKASLPFQKTLILEESAVFFSGVERQCSTCSTTGKRQKEVKRKEKWSDFSHIWLYHRPLLPWKPRQKSLNMIGPTMGSDKKIVTTGATNTTLSLSFLAHFGPAAKSLHTVPHFLDEGDKVAL